MCQPVCAGRSVCKVQLHPESEMPQRAISPQIPGPPIRHEPTKPTDLLLDKCIPKGWLNPTVHLSWKEVTLAKGKEITTNNTAWFKGRHPFPPMCSLHTVSNARDKRAGVPGAKGPDEPTVLFSEAPGLPSDPAIMQLQ